MKEIVVSLWELTREEAKTLPQNMQMLVYNPLAGTYHVEWGGKKNFVNNKHAIPQLKYFRFEEITKLELL